MEEVVGVGDLVYDAARVGGERVREEPIKSNLERLKKVD